MAPGLGTFKDFIDAYSTLDFKNDILVESFKSPDLAENCQKIIEGNCKQGLKLKVLILE